MSKAKNLSCSCGFQASLNFQHICPDCLGPLSVSYDFSQFHLSEWKKKLSTREKNIWRYREFLPPISSDPLPVVGKKLFRATRLEKELGIKEIWIKDDTSLPTHSFKDRPVALALEAAKRFSLEEIGCASTGNLAQAVASAGAKTGLKTSVFVPRTIEEAKIQAASVYGVNLELFDGDYDQLNYHCTLLAEEKGIGMVNINLRPYYAEGSKTIAFEIFEELDFRSPSHVFSPLASGSLLTKVAQATRAWAELGIVQDFPRIHGAQDEGCAPIADAFRSGAEEVLPVRSGDVLAHSLAIGNPGNGDSALREVRSSGGSVQAVSSEEIRKAISLLARTTGVWTESAGGVTVAGFLKALEEGSVSSDESVVLLITGEGLKTPEASFVKEKSRTLV